jgi:fructokinase
MLRIVACGEVLWDMFPTGRVLGGAPLNFMYRVNNLGHEGAVSSAVGAEPEGRELRAAMEALGLETRLIQTDLGHPTGRVDILFDAGKNPIYTIAPGVAYEFVRVDDALLRSVAECDCFSFSTLAQRNPVFREAIDQLLPAASREVLYDVNLRVGCYVPETVRRSLERCTLLKMNEEEVVEVGRIEFGAALPVPEILDRLLERYALLKCCLVTLGPKGCLAFDRSGRRVYSPGFVVDLVDPCGAGDSFAAGFICSLLSGADLKIACELGNALGALTAAQNGATTPLLRERIDALLQGEKRRLVEPTYLQFSPKQSGGSTMEKPAKRMPFREVFGNLNYSDEEMMRYPDVAPKAPAVWPPLEKDEKAPPKTGRPGK